MPQIYYTGPTALFPFRRKSYSRFLRTEKIHRPRPGLNLRTSDPVGSRITMGPPGSTNIYRISLDLIYISLTLIYFFEVGNPI